MTHPRRTTANFVLLPAVVIVGLACPDRDSARSPGETTVIAGPVSPAMMTADVATMSGDTLWALATDTIWSDSVEADRVCAADVSDCNRQINPKKVRVRLWAHKGAKDIHDTAVGPHGALIAKMENIGDARERMYGLVRENVYLLFLYAGTDTSGVYRLFEVSKTAPHRHRMIKEGRQIRCNHDQTWAKSWATFSGCEDGIPTPPSYITAGKSFSLIKTVYAASQATTQSKPAWVTCPSGCCTSGETEAY